MAPVRPADPAEAAAFLAARTAALGVPAVDEDEDRRLAGLPPFRGDDGAWAPWFVEGPAGRAYLGLRRPAAASGGAADAVAELAPEVRGPGGVALLREGLAAVRGLAGGPCHVWLRAVDPAELDAIAEDPAATVRRTMRILARDLTAPDGPRADAPVPPGIAIRSWRPGDDDGVVAVLAAAHPGSLRHWSQDALDRRRTAAWFHPEDLLVADRGGRLVGVHWTKRRGGGVGEVHNLALHPEAQGQGLGAALLDAGLRHLAAAGQREVLLWVDAANAPAVALYTSRGFAERRRDVQVAV